MNQQTLYWAVFVAVLCPLVLATPGQSLGVTTMHATLCMAMVVLADRRERRAQ